jgi:transcriptional regulator with XRE-family HTH domain
MQKHTYAVRGSEIATVRRASQLTQQQLAIRAHLCLQTIERIESQEYTIVRKHTFDALANALDL